MSGLDWDDEIPTDDEDELAYDIETILDEADEPMSVLDIVRRLVEIGYEFGADEEEVVHRALHERVSDEYVPLRDHRWIHLPSVLDGRVFTHQLTELECTHDVLTVSPDLTLLCRAADVGMLRLSDGTELEVVYPRVHSVDDEIHHREPALDANGSLILPAGTLAGLGLQATDLVTVQITDEGIALAKANRDELTAHDEFVRDRLLSLLPESHPIEVEDVLLELCGTSPAFDEARPPFAELVSALSLAWHGDWLAVPGFDIAQHFARARATSLAERYELDPAEAEILVTILRMHGEIALILADVTEDGAPREGRETAVAAVLNLLAEHISPAAQAANGGQPQLVVQLLPLLADPNLADAVYREAVPRGVEEAAGSLGAGILCAALELLASALDPLAPRQCRPALHWLRGKSRERFGISEKAEQEYLVAERLDPSWPLTLFELARYASDRGDAARGLALLRRAEGYEDPLLEKLLTRFLPQPGPVLPRNDRCWCGSGRKFKVCHLNRPDAAPLEERASWLYQKARAYRDGGRWYALSARLARLRAAHARTEDEIQRAVREPLITDAVLFEGGVFAEFVEERGYLLPADEQLLAQQWLLVERSLFEISDVQPGGGFTVRDLRTGDVHEVREVTASRQLKAGALICARVVPAGDTTQIFGGVEEIPMAFRDGLLKLLDSKPDAENLVTFLTSRFAPPQLVNYDGDSLEFCEAQLQTADAARLTQQLDEAFERPDPDKLEWLELREIEGYDRICANLSLAGSELRLHTNSAARFADALSTLWDLDPNLELVSQKRTPTPTAREVSKLAAAHPGPSGAIDPENAPPEVQEAMAAYMADYEQKWLDLPIPALAGLTPRQAADDPTRRDDLIRLLAGFDTPTESPMQMSSSRLRTALGITG